MVRSSDNDSCVHPYQRFYSRTKVKLFWSTTATAKYASKGLTPSFLFEDHNTFDRRFGTPKNSLSSARCYSFFKRDLLRLPKITVFSRTIYRSFASYAVTVVPKLAFLARFVASCSNIYIPPVMCISWLGSPRHKLSFYYILIIL